MISERVDVLILGATGYTGKYVVAKAVKIFRELTWGIAGRSKEKLENVLHEVSEKFGEDLSKVKMIVANVKDKKSLLEMAQSSKIIVNCIGPYHLYGEQVVQACIEAGTHHVDISAETQYIESMQLKYHQHASEKGIYIVSSCGMDSIPAELGSVFLEEKFDGTVNSVETYMELRLRENFKAKGARVNHGTWESGLLYVANMRELRNIRRELFPTPLPELTPKMGSRFPLHKSDIVGNQWCIQYPGLDKDVMTRSQRHFFAENGKRPFQIKVFVVTGSLFNSISLIFGMGLAAVLVQCSLFRKLLVAHPKLFSAGYISSDGPSEETNENTRLKMTFYGEGWKEKNADDKTPINKKIITRVSTDNPGYGATATSVLLAAVTILKEKEKMPGSGGVFSPAAAFGKTGLIEKLQSNGYTFEVIKIVE